ncbi:MAG: magnesium transporter, partial [Thermodesulfobacteriota bacterium]
MELQTLTQEINNYIDNGNSDAIKTTLAEVHPSEIASIIQNIDPEKQSFILDSLDPETASEVYFELDSEQREEIIVELDEEKIADIADEMESDDAADLIGELPEDTAGKVLSKMDPEEAKDVEPLLQYPDDTAGGIMQTELVKVTKETSVRDAINWIRLIADDVEEFHGIYVTDKVETLRGFIPLHKLIIANPNSSAESIMEEMEISATPYMDQEEVADIFKKYDLVTLPVVNDGGTLLGRITADDVIDVITEEAEEDIYQLAGLKEHLHPIYTPTYERIKARTPWLLLTLVGELLIALIIIRVFEPTLQKVAILAAFMPAIMATGGNVGLQTTTIIVRSLGMGTIKAKQIFKLMLAEVKVGIVLGTICGFFSTI